MHFVHYFLRLITVEQSLKYRGLCLGFEHTYNMYVWERNTFFFGQKGLSFNRISLIIANTTPYAYRRYDKSFLDRRDSFVN